MCDGYNEVVNIMEESCLNVNIIFISRSSVKACWLCQEYIYMYLFFFFFLLLGSLFYVLCIMVKIYVDTFYWLCQ